MARDLKSKRSSLITVQTLTERESVGRSNSMSIDEKSVCDMDCDLAVKCIEKAMSIQRGNCNSIFSQWNHCLAKAHGFLVDEENP